MRNVKLLNVSFPLLWSPYVDLLRWGHGAQANSCSIDIVIGRCYRDCAWAGPHYLQYLWSSTSDLPSKPDSEPHTIIRPRQVGLYPSLSWLHSATYQDRRYPCTVLRSWRIIKLLIALNMWRVTNSINVRSPMLFFPLSYRWTLPKALKIY